MLLSYGGGIGQLVEEADPSVSRSLLAHSFTPLEYGRRPAPGGYRVRTRSFVQ